jgi:ABC-type polysaccharide/polyol phosphate export permease
MDLRTRYRRSILGLGWSLLHPIAMTVILCTAFSRIMHVANIQEYAIYLFSGLACWNFICSVTMTGCTCFLSGETYIRQYPAPLAIYPLRTVLGGSIHFLISLAVVLGLAVFMKGGFSNPLALFSLIPSLLLLLILTWSLALIAGFANVLFQDTQHLTEIGFQILFYLTPIIYPESQLKEHPALAELMRYNPVVPFLKLIRDPMLNGSMPSLATYAAASLTVTVMFALAAAVLIRLQRRLIFYL